MLFMDKNIMIQNRKEDDENYKTMEGRLPGYEDIQCDCCSDRDAGQFANLEKKMEIGQEK